MALSHSLRLRKSSDFQRVRQQGRSTTSRLLILAWIPNNLSSSRIGFVVSKRISKRAVDRNYLKRLLSEIARSALPELSPGYDIVVTVRYQVVHNKRVVADLASLQRDLLSLLRRAHLLQSLPTSQPAPPLHPNRLIPDSSSHQDC